MTLDEKRIFGQVILEKILTQFEKLFYNKPNPKWKEMEAFHMRMVKYKNHLFKFLLDPMIPPDNNASEKAIRNVKAKQKERFG